MNEVDPLLGVQIDPASMHGALFNLLTNAFKFTHPKSVVSLTAYGQGDHVLISVADMCGGLPPIDLEKMFLPFFQSNDDKSGVGLGLSFARNTVEANGGTLTVRDRPGIGCVFTIALPRHTFH